VTGAVTLPDQADAALEGETGDDWAGISVTGPGDLDSDGHGDLLVGAPGWPGPYTGYDYNYGTAYLWHGPVSGTHSLADADAILRSAGGADYAGMSVASAGDVNGDAVPDLLVGCLDTDHMFKFDPGQAYLVLGPGPSGEVSLDDSDAELVSTVRADLDSAGYPVAGAGDVDGDGFGDVLVGAQDDDDGGRDAGAAYLVLGPMTGTVSLGDGIKIVGEDPDANAGFSLAGAGDTDGDGLDDILVGAPDWSITGSHRGAAYLLQPGLW
jgi:hypothetical protein